jgi:mono/diheme cytochrome c family protein
MPFRKLWLLAVVLIASLTVTSAALAQEGGGDPERGGQLYVETCAVCHGVEGKGRVGASLENFPGIDVTAALRQTIAEGIQGSVMPAWSEAEGGPLSDRDIDDIVAYVSSSIAGSEPIAPAPEYQPPEIEPPPDVEGDPSQGAVVFQGNCVMCHGEAGRGRFGAPLAKTWPGNQPEVFIQQVVSRGISGSTMPAWSTERGGPLTETDIENVTAYVLSLEPAQTASTPTPAPAGPLDLTTSFVLFIGLLVLVAVVLVVYYRRGSRA